MYGGAAPCFTGGTPNERSKTVNARPKTKAARNIKAGEWLEFGGLAYLAGRPSADEETVWIPLGYGGVELRPNARVKMHYED